MKSPSPRFVALLIGATLSSTAAEAATLFDPFTDGALVGGADASGLSWYRRSANQTIGIVNDSGGLGSGNALQLTVSSTTNRPILGVFSDFTLVNAGDQISLTLDFRFAATPTANTADGWRFGFYNANGTLMTANGGAESDNDFGYLASIGTGTSSGFNLYEEQNATSNAGETGFGADRFSLSPTVNATAAINDTAKHTLVFTITKTASGVSIATTVDSISLGTGVDTNSPYLTFNEVLISHAATQAYLIDNVTVTTTTVPEPGSAALLGMGALGLFGWRRSRRS